MYYCNTRYISNYEVLFKYKCFFGSFLVNFPNNKISRVDWQTDSCFPNNKISRVDWQTDSCQIKFMTRTVNNTVGCNV